MASFNCAMYECRVMTDYNQLAEKLRKCQQERSGFAEQIALAREMKALQDECQNCRCSNKRRKNSNDPDRVRDKRTRRNDDVR